MFSTNNKSDGHNYKQRNRGCNFETWLENARECTLRPIPIVDVPFQKYEQSDLRQKEDKFIEEPILKFDDGELVYNKDILICEDKCIILEKRHILK